MENLSKLKENVLTIYGGAEELKNTILVLAYLFLQVIVLKTTPQLYNTLAQIRAKLSIRGRLTQTKIEGIYPPPQKSSSTPS